MSRLTSLFVLLLALTIFGCGGGGTLFTQISGVVTDEDGNVVRGATVWCNDRQTLSNSGGVYAITGVGTGDRAVHAEIWKDGLLYSGHNVVQVFENERSKSINIAVVPGNRQASIHGSVRDSHGNKLAGVRIFAFGNALSSMIAKTDSDGNYRMDELAAGLTYTVTASGRFYDNESFAINLGINEDRLVNFMLDDESNPAIPAPDNLSAVAWTTPFEQTRGPSERAALEAVKKLIDPRYARIHADGRSSTLGNHIEVDLYWDELPSQYYGSLLGYGIYRATTAQGASVGIDFLLDPLTLFYSDVDDVLRPGRAYYYEITALNTSYPDTGNSESDFSDRYGVMALDDMRLLPPTFGPLTFHWLPVSGADGYEVYLFDEYPGIGVDVFWDNSGSPTAGTSLVYTGPALTPLRRYYYVVLGTANGSDSRTLSVIGEFVAN